MKYSNETIKFVDYLIRTHCHFNGECYDVYIYDLADFDLCKLSGLIMQDNLNYAAESTGHDNDSYPTELLPSLIKFMLDINNKESEQEFVSTWLKYVSSHFNKTINFLLNDRLSEYNSLEGCFGQYPSHEPQRGYLPWN